MQKKNSGTKFSSLHTEMCSAHYFDVNPLNQFYFFTIISHTLLDMQREGSSYSKLALNTFDMALTEVDFINSMIDFTVIIFTWIQF